MCELFAMSSYKPTALTYSLEEFSKNGSSLRSNRDGWGIALASDRDAILVKEPRPASDSIWVQFIAGHSIETNMAIAHVRYATRGKHTMENTHPFRRALGRSVQLFAHNGTLKDIESALDIDALAYKPIGDTDSEVAFCELLTRLKPLYDGDALPAAAARIEVFQSVCEELRLLGSCNFLYYDGDILFAHGHKRVHEENGIYTDPKPPGLNVKRCWTCAAQTEVRCPGLDVELHDQQTVLLASVPLDEEGWEPLDEGAVLAIKDGVILNNE